METKSFSPSGDDVVELMKGASVIDTFGRKGEVSVFDVCGVKGASKDHTLVRKPHVQSGTTSWGKSAGLDCGSCEWVVQPKDHFLQQGAHAHYLPKDDLAWVVDTAKNSALSPLDADTVFKTKALGADFLFAVQAKLGFCDAATFAGLGVSLKAKDAQDAGALNVLLFAKEQGCVTMLGALGYAAVVLPPHPHAHAKGCRTLAVYSSHGARGTEQRAGWGVALVSWAPPHGHVAPCGPGSYGRLKAEWAAPVAHATPAWLPLSGSYRGGCLTDPATLVSSCLLALAGGSGSAGRAARARQVQAYRRGRNNDATYQWAGNSLDSAGFRHTYPRPPPSISPPPLTLGPCGYGRCSGANETALAAPSPKIERPLNPNLKHT